MPRAQAPVPSAQCPVPEPGAIAQARLLPGCLGEALSDAGAVGARRQQEAEQ